MRQFDGLLARASHSWVIVVRRGLSGDRQRFTLAHELGHILLDGKLPATLDLEKACNRFAGAFLVPCSEAFRVLGTSRRTLEPVELQIAKHEWGLSMAGWVHRAEELGIVNDSAAASLWSMFRSDEVSPGVSWRVREPGAQYPTAAPSLFRQSVFHALAEGLINESKAAELLGITLIELRAMRKLEIVDASSDHRCEHHH